MGDVVKIKVTVSTNMIGSDCEFETEYDREDWEEMTEQQRNETIHEELMQSGLVNWDWQIIDG